MSAQNVPAEPPVADDLVSDDEELSEDHPEPESRITPDQPPSDEDQ